MSALGVESRGFGMKKISLIIIIIVFITIILGLFYNQITKPKQTIQQPLPTTIMPTTVIPQTSATQILESDQNWGNKSQEINSNYPWLDQFPLTTDEYFVYFDINKKLFIAKIFSSKTEDTKTKISNELAQKGIDITKYIIQWEIQ